MTKGDGGKQGSCFTMMTSQSQVLKGERRPQCPSVNRQDLIPLRGVLAHFTVDKLEGLNLGLFT